MSPFGRFCCKTLKNAVRLISRQNSKRAPIATRYGLRFVADLAHEFVDRLCGPSRKRLNNSVLVQTRLSKGLFPIHGDRVQLQQVVLNLFLNAVEAIGSTEAGGTGVVDRWRSFELVSSIISSLKYDSPPKKKGVLGSAWSPRGWSIRKYDESIDFVACVRAGI